MFKSVLNSSNSDLNRQNNEISADTRKLGYFSKLYDYRLCTVSRWDEIFWSYQLCSCKKNWFRFDKWSDRFRLVILLDIIPPHQFYVGLLRQSYVNVNTWNIFWNVILGHIFKYHILVYLSWQRRSSTILVHNFTFASESNNPNTLMIWLT